MAEELGSRPSPESGFTLIELLVSMVLTVQVLAAVYFLFDFNSRLAKVQTNLTDLQQAQRVAQYEVSRLVRMAGRGNLPQNQALAIQNNVPTLTRIGSPTSPPVLPGSDIIQVRGAFSSPIYQVPPDATAFTLDNTPNLATRGSFVVSRVSPSGVIQDLTPVRDAINNRVTEALVLISSEDDRVIAVVELDPAASTGNDPDQATVAFRISGGVNTASFGALSSTPPFPPTLTAIRQFAILEEYRYYVRETYARPGDSTSKLLPKLSRARMFPGTQVPYNSLATNLDVDVADDIWDLQVSLAYNTALQGGEIDSNGVGSIVESADGQNDDWLYNNRNDNAADPVWNGTELYYLRLSTLARSTESDRGYQAPLLNNIEDKFYNITPWVGLLGVNSDENRKFRRRILQTVVEFRNSLL